MNKTQLIINIEKLDDNIKKIKRHIGDKGIYFVCKSSCYGLGTQLIEKIINNPNIDGFCVATLDEGIELRKIGIKKKIIVTGLINLNLDLKVVQDFDLEIVVPSIEFLKALPKEMVYQSHLAVDVGLGRIGINSLHEIFKAGSYLRDNNLILSGVYTHHSSDKEIVVKDEQKRFQEFVSQLNASYKSIHSGSSSHILLNSIIGDYYRIGSAIVGMKERLYESLQLKPIASLISEISFVKKVKKGEHVGYYSEFQVPKNGYIANISLGYGDGFSSRMSGVCIDSNGKTGYIASVCMNQSLIFFESEIKCQDIVTIIGEGSNSINDICKHLKINEDEFFCCLNSNIQRIFK